MAASSPVRSMGWTQRSVADTIRMAMSDYRKEVGRRVVSVRESRGLSQEDLAHAAGLSVKTVSRVENGHHEMRGSTLRSIARALDVDETELRGTPPAPLGLSEPADLGVDLAALSDRVDHLTRVVVNNASRLDHIATTIAAMHQELLDEHRVAHSERHRLLDVLGQNLRQFGQQQQEFAQLEQTLRDLFPRDAGDPDTPKRHASRG